MQAAQESRLGILSRYPAVFRSFGHTVESQTVQCLLHPLVAGPVTQHRGMFRIGTVTFPRLLQIIGCHLDIGMIDRIGLPHPGFLLQKTFHILNAPRQFHNIHRTGTFCSIHFPFRWRQDRAYLPGPLCLLQRLLECGKIRLLRQIQTAQ